MSYFKIHKEDDRKEFVSFLVMGEGDKYYLPNFEKKSYLRVPKGYVLYYPYTRKYDVCPVGVRFDYNFKLTDKGYSWEEIGRDTYRPQLNLYSNPIDNRYIMWEWMSHNLMQHFAKQDYINSESIFWKVKALEDKGYRRINYFGDIAVGSHTLIKEEENRDETYRYKFYSYPMHQKIKSRLKNELVSV